MNEIHAKTAMALALASLAGVAAGQASAPAAEPPPTVVALAPSQLVEVTGHYDNAVGSSDAASQGTVRGERLTDLPLLRPGEVLETIPGMVVTQHSGDGKVNQYFLRGYNLDHGTDFATSVDGVPVNMPTNAHGQGYTDLNFLIPELTSKIEYRKLVYSADSAIGSTQANGASKRHGVEWNNHLVVNRWLLVDADMAWTHARYADRNADGDTGNYIGNAVSRVGLFGVAVHQLGPWSAGLVTRFIGSYPLSQDGTLTTPGAVVSNLQVKRDITPRFALALDVLNLFDRKFCDIAYQQDYRVSPTSPVVPGGVTVHPGEPRAFRVSLNVRL